MRTTAGRCEVAYVHEGRVRSARRAIRDDRTTRHLSETFKMLGDPTRLRIVLALGREELCVCDIAALLGMTVSAISHQLRLLKTMRVVKYRRTGKMAYYSLDDEHVEDLIRFAARHVAEAR